MPIIYRPPQSGAGPTKDPLSQWSEQSLRNVPLDWDENRKEAEDAPSDSKKIIPAICAFVKQSQLKLKSDGNFELLYKRTLEMKMRDSVLDDVERKQKELMQMFDFADKDAEEKARGELLDMPDWPKKEVEVVAKFKDQLAPAVATGFAIGGAVMITAGHCVEDESDPISNYFAVFEMTKKMVSSGIIPAAKVYKIKRVIQRAIAADYDPVVTQKPTPWRAGFKLEEWTKKGLHYDCAVIELDRPVAASISLSTIPPSLGAEVFTVGSPKGLPLKYARGGKVLSAVDISGVANAPVQGPAQLKLVGPTENATFTADIDTFRGNSGGPLIITGQNLVIGIVRSGSIHPFADSSFSAEAMDKPDQSKVQNVNDWAKKQTLKPDVEEKVKAADFPIANHSLITDLDEAWIHGYDQMKTTKDSSKIYWLRFLAESAAIRNLNRFTRVDSLSYFTRSMSELANPGKDAPMISVYLTVDVKLLHTGSNINSNMALKINSTTASAEADTVAPPSAAGWTPNAVVQWKRIPNADAQINKPKSGIGNLPHSACNWPHGVCDWTSLDVVRKDGTMWKQNTLVQASAEVLMNFWRPADTVKPPRWQKEDFTFSVDLKFKVSKDQLSLTAPIGDLVPGGATWIQW